MNSALWFNTNFNQELFLITSNNKHIYEGLSLNALCYYMNTEVFHAYEYLDSIIKVREIRLNTIDGQLKVWLLYEHMQNFSKASLNEFNETIENLKNDLNEYLRKHPTAGKIPKTSQIFVNGDFFTKFNDDDKDFYALQISNPQYAGTWDD